MKNRLSGLAYIFIFVMVLTILAMVMSADMHFKAKFLPMSFAGGIFLLAVVGLTRELLKKKAPMPAKADAESDDVVKLRQYLSPAIWILGFTLGIYLIGLLASIVVLVLSYTKSHGSGWLGSIIATAATAAIIYFVFQDLLQIELYPGLVLTILNQ